MSKNKHNHILPEEGLYVGYRNLNVIENDHEPPTEMERQNNKKRKKNQ